MELCPEAGPLCDPSVALATHPYGEEKHLPPSSAACHASSCPAQVPSILGLLTTPWLGLP